MKSRLFIGFIVYVVLMTTSCFKYESVKPWQKKDLSRADMQLGDGFVIQTLKEHNHASKEAAAGSATASSSGCGCN